MNSSDTYVIDYAFAKGGICQTRLPDLPGPPDPLARPANPTLPPDTSSRPARRIGRARAVGRARQIGAVPA